MSKEKLSYAQQVCVKSAGKAMQRTGMVGPGAKVGVAVSGGVDSWVLLEVAPGRRQRIVPFRFDIMAIHLNPGFDAENHAPLVEYLAKHGVAATSKSRITARAGIRRKTAAIPPVSTAPCCAAPGCSRYASGTG